MIEIHPTLGPSAELCAEALYDFRSLFGPVAGTLKDRESETCRVLAFLHASCLFTSSTVAFLVGHLVGHERLWDAEVLTRSVLEGTYKLLFMCVREPAERLARVTQYHEQLGQIERLKIHRQAKDSLAVIDDPESSYCQPIRELLLGDDEFQALQEQWPAKLRRELEEKWSFHNMAKSLAKADLPAARYLELMRYDYSRASRLIHMGSHGMYMQLEDDQYPAQARAIRERAHGLGLLSNVFQLALYRCVAAYHILDLRTEPVLEMLKKYSPLIRVAEDARREWQRYTVETA